MAQARVPVHYFEKKAKPRAPSHDGPTEELKQPVGLSRHPSLGEMEPQVSEMYRTRLPAIYQKIKP